MSLAGAASLLPMVALALLPGRVAGASDVDGGLLRGPAATRQAPSPKPAATDPASLATGYRLMTSDLAAHFWNPHTFAHIRPTRGGNPGIGEVDNTLFAPSFWQMAQYANVLFWDWKLTRSEASRAVLLAQWRHIRMLWSDQELASAAPSSRIMYVSDDAAWAINYLVQAYEATGDARALRDAQALLPNIRRRWADPNVPPHGPGGSEASPHGLLYATPTEDPDHQGVASLYESMIANAALAIHRATRDEGELAYARATFAWSRKYLRQEATGIYYTELDIRPRRPDGSVNPHYLRPVGDNFGAPVRGLEATYLGGTMSMGVLAARLYALTGEASYLAEAQSTAAAIARRDTYLRPGGALVNARDPWTEGYWAPTYAAEVLTLPGVDPAHRLSEAMTKTAASILSRRTAAGYYGADWTGPERNPLNGSMTWIEDAAMRSTGSGAGQALPSQVMTSSSSAAMVQGGLAARKLRPARD